MSGTLITASEMPEFIEGNDKLFKFIGNHLRYPSVAVENGIQGTVSIQFVVDQSGQVTTVNILRGIGGGCGEEAIRVVKLLKFKPGKQNGTPVKVQFSLPIRFKIRLVFDT
ncbi:energy transducer TonB [Solitalea koreensis]|uniref:TonB family C-terminal domain-containing protein n=1 Tax=Solitalea koreensis TaxID=543615 RepID=A0A521D889_9SPHI|nr:energy transducer TonB [Solitalea koreensis]SMO67909.1 TonB family C-terminal domain-containing protein [Solitalea koreensis]